MTFKEHKVGDLIDQVRGLTYRKDHAMDRPELGYIAVLRANNIGDDFRIIKDDFVYIQEKNIRNYLEKGDILIATSSGSRKVVGKGAQFDGFGIFSFGAFCKVLRPKSKEVLPEYLGYYFQSHSYKTEIKKLAVGSNILNLKNKDINELKVRVPDLAAQRQIVAALDKVKALIDKRQQSMELLDELLRATFLDMFGDPVSNSRQWPTTPFTDIGKFLGGGTPSKHREDYWEGDIPWVSPKDMKVDYVKESIDHISVSALEETSVKLIPENSLLIVVRGMILAHSVPVALTKRPVTINQDMKGIVISPEFFSEYVLYCTKFMKIWLLEFVSTAAHGTKKFAMQDLRKVMVPKPPLELQSSFVKTSKSIESMKLNLIRSKGFIEELFQSLLQRAFHGDLVVGADLQLDGLLESKDYEGIVKDETLVQKLIDRCNKLKTEESDPELYPKNSFFGSFTQYETIREFVFRLLNEKKVAQVFDEGEEQTKLEII